MKRLYSFLLMLAMLPAVYAQPVPSTADPGSFAAGERAITFSDAGLANPNVSAHAFYPANGPGLNQPLASGSFPVIAFGHGFNLDYLDYQIICRHLATWGYIVVTPDVQNGFSVDHLEFARELAACITHVQSEGGNAASPFYQHVDSMCGVIGHSMGGGASALVPSVFPGIDAVSGLAAAETNPSAIAALANYAGPYQVISASLDNTAPEASHQVPMYNAATGLKMHVSITGGGHCKFTDGSTVCDFVSSAGTITRAEQILLARKYATAFFNYFLKLDPAAEPFICGDSLSTDDIDGLLDFSSTVCAVGLSDPDPSTSLAWPQPCTRFLRHTLQGPLSLRDIQGRTLLQADVQTASEGVLDLGQLPQGVYLLQHPGGMLKVLKQ